MSELARKKGWCPGVLRPMPAGDGLLVRLRLTGGILSPTLALSIAGLAQGCGNGCIDISSRANLQLRGIREECLSRLQDGLGQLGLLDDSIEAEAVRNVMASPLAGLDPALAPDIRPVTAALERKLAQSRDLHVLPAKFLFLIDDGSDPGLCGQPADVRFTWSQAAGHFRIGLGGAENVGFGNCGLDDLPERAATIAQLFLALRGTGAQAVRRMRHLVERIGGDALASGLGVAAQPCQPDSRAFNPARCLGPHNFGIGFFTGLAAPFGRLQAGDLAQLARLVHRQPGAELRLTPWRMLLAVGIGETAARDFSSHPGLSAWIADAADPRLAVAACSGFAACAQATTQVQDDAARLALALQSPQGAGIQVHVSGCAKGCAHNCPATLTLVGHGGLYDLVENGFARDAPARSGLTLAEVVAFMHARQTGTLGTQKLG